MELSPVLGRSRYDGFESGSTSNSERVVELGTLCQLIRNAFSVGI